MKEDYATRITGHTLVGYATNEFPVSGKGGNCFSVSTKTSGEIRILNFGMENLDHLVKERGLKWPIKIMVIESGHGVINDGRIGDRWYSSHFCEVCTPYNLLPLPQRLSQLRQIDRGEREEYNSGRVSVKLLCQPQIP